MKVFLRREGDVQIFNKNGRILRIADATAPAGFYAGYPGGRAEMYRGLKDPRKEPWAAEWSRERRAANLPTPTNNLGRQRL